MYISSSDNATTNSIFKCVIRGSDDFSDDVKGHTETSFGSIPRAEKYSKRKLSDDSSDSVKGHTETSLGSIPRAEEYLKRKWSDDSFDSVKGHTETSFGSIPRAEKYSKKKFEQNNPRDNIIHSMAMENENLKVIGDTVER